MSRSTRAPRRTFLGTARWAAATAAVLALGAPAAPHVAGLSAGAERILAEREAASAGPAVPTATLVGDHWSLPVPVTLVGDHWSLPVPVTLVGDHWSSVPPLPPVLTA